ncbi:MAG TPA: VOC family protein [Candidatus Binatia bacterium]|jgi:catechol 2,3-dioxygenase-like lactoylglutathione lyase family enzyme|nr:VOC family protein [Candidatus Binatia bacterium]
MRLLDHVSITVRDLARVRPFYDAIMAVLGAAPAYARDDAIGYGQRNRDGDDDHTYVSVFASAAATADPRRHWCFRATSADAVRAFHAAGLASGGRNAGAPGPRPDYHVGYVAAFLEDPEGNRIEAVWHRGAS